MTGAYAHLRAAITAGWVFTLLVGAAISAFLFAWWVQGRTGQGGSCVCASSACRMRVPCAYERPADNWSTSRVACSLLQEPPASPSILCPLCATPRRGTYAPNLPSANAQNALSTSMAKATNEVRG